MICNHCILFYLDSTQCPNLFGNRLAEIPTGMQMLIVVKHTVCLCCPPTTTLLCDSEMMNDFNKSVAHSYTIGR